MDAIPFQESLRSGDNGKAHNDMQAKAASAPMTDRELAEIEFFASVGVFSEDYVTRLVAEVRRLQEEVASVSGIDMLVAPDSVSGTEHGDEKTRNTGSGSRTTSRKNT